jgi:integrase
MLRVKKYPKRSPYFYIRGTERGIRVFESTGETDRVEAERLCRERRQQIIDKIELGRDKPACFAEAVNAYIDFGGEERFLKPLILELGPLALDQIGQAQVDRAAKKLYPDAKASTLVRQVYGPVISILRHAADSELPGARRPAIKHPKVDQVAAQWANDDHIEKLIKAAPPRLAAFILVTTTTGLRFSEMARQRSADYRLRPGWVNIGRTKTGDPALVPLSPAAYAAVMAIMPADPAEPVFGFTTVQGLNKALASAAERAELPYLSSHKIGRHSFAARILGRGKDIKTLKEAGRWKKLQTVDERYGHLEMRHAHEAMLDAAGAFDGLTIETAAHKNPCNDAVPPKAAGQKDQ